MSTAASCKHLNFESLTGESDVERGLPIVFECGCGARQTLSRAGKLGPWRKSASRLTSMERELIRAILAEPVRTLSDALDCLRRIKGVIGDEP